MNRKASMIKRVAKIAFDSYTKAYGGYSNHSLPTRNAESFAELVAEAEKEGAAEQQRLRDREKAVAKRERESEAKEREHRRREKTLVEVEEAAAQQKQELDDRAKQLDEQAKGDAK